jgi:hypothetical protein
MPAISLEAAAGIAPTGSLAKQPAFRFLGLFHVLQPENLLDWKNIMVDVVDASVGDDATEGFLHGGGNGQHH